MNNDTPVREATVLGQKYAYATISLVLALMCFINLAAMEKALAAIAFGALALKNQPTPALTHRRSWAWAGVTIGIAFVVIVPTILFVFIGTDGLREIFETLVRMGAAK
jgi:hypothetical protein